MRNSLQKSLVVLSEKNNCRQTNSVDVDVTRQKNAERSVQMFSRLSYEYTHHTTGILQITVDFKA